MSEEKSNSSKVWLWVCIIIIGLVIIFLKFFWFNNYSELDHVVLLGVIGSYIMFLIFCFGLLSLLNGLELEKRLENIIYLSCLPIIIFIYALIADGHINIIHPFDFEELYSIGSALAPMFSFATIGVLIVNFLYERKKNADILTRQDKSIEEERNRHEQNLADQKALLKSEMEKHKDLLKRQDKALEIQQNETKLLFWKETFLTFLDRQMKPLKMEHEAIIKANIGKHDYKNNIKEYGYTILEDYIFFFKSNREIFIERQIRNMLSIHNTILQYLDQCPIVDDERTFTAYVSIYESSVGSEALPFLFICYLQGYCDSNFRYIRWYIEEIVKTDYSEHINNHKEKRRKELKL